MLALFPESLIFIGVLANQLIHLLDLGAPSVLNHLQDLLVAHPLLL